MAVQGVPVLVPNQTWIAASKYDVARWGAQSDTMRSASDGAIGGSIWANMSIPASPSASNTHLDQYNTSEESAICQRLQQHEE